MAYKEMNCPFCGRSIRSSDKFCIFCGNRIAQRPAKPSESKLGKISVEEEKELEQEVNNDLIAGLTSKRGSNEENAEKIPFLVSEPSQDDLEDRVLTPKEGNKKKGEEETTEIELPDDIRDQLETKMKLSLLDERKQKLNTKLKELTENLDEHRYEWDMEYAQNINVKLNAFKSLKSEFDKEEEQLRADLGGDFRVDELQELIILKREQLIELKRTFKHHQVKKDVYEQLKLEYADEFKKIEKELSGYRSNIVRWLSKEKAEKNRLEGRIRLLQGRFKAKEISKEAFEEQKTEFDKQIETYNQRIRILENYAREKKRSIF